MRADHIAHFLGHVAGGGGLSADDGKEARRAFFGMIIATIAPRGETPAPGGIQDERTRRRHYAAHPACPAPGDHPLRHFEQAGHMLLWNGDVIRVRDCPGGGAEDAGVALRHDDIAVIGQVEQIDDHVAQPLRDGGHDTRRGFKAELDTRHARHAVGPGAGRVDDDITAEGFCGEAVAALNADLAARGVNADDFSEGMELRAQLSAPWR